MKLKLSMAAAAVSMAFAGQANALLLPSSGNSSLFLAVWDTGTGNATYVSELTPGGTTGAQGTGLRLNDFLPNSVNIASGDGGPGAGTRTPTTGLSLTFNPAGLQQFIASNSTSAVLNWGVYGMDAQGGTITGGTLGTANRTRIVTTLNTGTANPILVNSGLNAIVLNADSVTIPGFNDFNCGTNSSCQTNLPTGSIGGGGENAGFWGGTFGGTTVGPNGSAIGTAQDFLYIGQGQGTVGSVSAPTTQTWFENASGRAKWNLGSDGVLTYTLAAEGGGTEIPVPAAVWLFGSGLLGLVGVARRQRKAA